MLCWRRLTNLARCDSFNERKACKANLVTEKTRKTSVGNGGPALLWIWQRVTFNHGHTGGAALAAHSRGVIARLEGLDQSGFAGVSRGESRLLNFGWLPLPPVVVSPQNRPVRIPEFQGRILQRSVYSKSRERWSNHAHNDSVCPG